MPWLPIYVEFEIHENGEQCLIRFHAYQCFHTYYCFTPPSVFRPTRVSKPINQTPPEADLGTGYLFFLFKNLAY